VEEISPIATDVNVSDICCHLAAGGFSKHIWPKRLEIVEQMPRTPTGKIQKFVLRKAAKKLAPEGGAPVNFYYRPRSRPIQ